MLFFFALIRFMPIYEVDLGLLTWLRLEVF